VSAAEFPNNERRVLTNFDEAQVFIERSRGTSDPEEIKAIFEQSVDELAEAGVDTLVWVTFGRFQAMSPSKAIPEVTAYCSREYILLCQAGYDPIDLLVDRCHQHGMEFIACLRMNDRHELSTAVPVGQFITDHPEWHLKGRGGGPGVNYAYEPVREKVLAYIEELVASHDVDGVEFDYMRWCHMFEPGEGQQNAHLLTDFTRKTRQLLDAAAQRRGRERLVLGVRVPQTLDECEYLGFDVATWIKEGLVDYVVPSDFFYTDFNAPTEDFVKLAEGTDCKIYPAIHPRLCMGDRARIANLANYRAAVQNFYAYGADGLETYNAVAPGYLRELRDPQTVSQGDRHYLFYPLWTRPSESGFVHDDRIILDRAQWSLRPWKWPKTSPWRSGSTTPKSRTSILFASFTPMGRTRGRAARWMLSMSILSTWIGECWHRRSSMATMS